MRKRFSLCLLAFFLAIGMSLPRVFADEDSKPCPCEDSINKFAQTYENDAGFKVLIDEAFENMQQAPEGYREGGNPWIGKGFDDLLKMLREWCTFLPVAKGSSDTGFTYIKQMDLFCYNNPFGKAAFQTSPGMELFSQFAEERGAFLNSPESKKYVPVWLSDPRAEKEDYVLPDPGAKDGGFKSFNEFFSRSLKNQGPVTAPNYDGARLHHCVPDRRGDEFDPRENRR